MDFAVPADNRAKLKESEKKDKYQNLARELKKLKNMKVMVIPIITGALGTVTKGLSQGLKDLEIIGQVETIQTTVLLRSAMILRRILETWGDSSEKSSVKTYVKSYQGLTIIKTLENNELNMIVNKSQN